jgi:hypothetical protein
MTVLTYVTKSEMENRTGFKNALGYAYPKEDEILIRKNLPKEIEKEVKQHEEEHILKGEEGPGLFDFAGKIFGGKSKKKGAKRARKAGEKASQEQRAIFEAGTAQARDDHAPYRQAGATALDAMMSMTGLGLTNFGETEAGRKAEDRRVTADDYLGVFAESKLGKKGKRRLDQFRALNPYHSGYGDQQYIDDFMASVGGKRTANKLGNFQQQNPYGAAYGGAIYPQGRAYGGPMMGHALQGDSFAKHKRGFGKTAKYNVNEIGPENVYGGGAVTRNSNPQTIEPSGDGYVQPNENPGGVAGGYNFQTDPGYDFRFNEGMRGLERGAAARGGLLSGGFGRKAVRYGQDYASNEYNNVYNRIANIAGLGQVAAGSSGGYAMQGGALGSNAIGNSGYYGASGYASQGNIWGDAVNSLGQAGQDWWDNRNSQPSGPDHPDWIPNTVHN